jgi:hypothetical protein
MTVKTLSSLDVIYLTLAIGQSSKAFGMQLVRFLKTEETNAKCMQHISTKERYEEEVINGCIQIKRQHILKFGDRKYAFCRAFHKVLQYLQTIITRKPNDLP